MAQVPVRNLDDQTALRRKAELRGRSLEQEVRIALIAAARFGPEERVALSRRVRAMTPKMKQTDSADIYPAGSRHALTPVIDAGVACKRFISETLSDHAGLLLVDPSARIAPDLIVPEVCNIARTKLRRGEIVAEQATAAPGPSLI